MNRFFTLLLLLLVGIVLSSPQLSAQTDPSTPPRVVEPRPDTAVAAQNYFEGKPSYAAGLNFGLISGAGLSGRFHHPVGVELQLTFALLSVGSYFHTNVGIEGQYGFIRNRDERFYALLGGGLYSSTSSDTTLPGNRIANPFRFGFGFGYEYFLSRQFVMSLSGALSVFPSTGEVLPTPEIGFFFYFR
jgi:hypothetical protein